MHANVDYLIAYIKREIPPAILEYAFCPPPMFNNYAILRPSLDAMLRDKIIDGWVMRDCNVAHGIEVTIDLSCGSMEYVEGGTLIRIPNHATAGKTIVSVLSTSYSLSSAYEANSGSELVESAIGARGVGSARIALVGPNTLYVEGGLTSTLRYLRCMVENDKDFANISPRSLFVIGELCVLAAKSYIYNNCIINAENAPYIQGIPQGKLAEIIGEWNDASTMYKEYRQMKLKKVLHMNDRTSNNRLIRAIMPR